MAFTFIRMRAARWMALGAIVTLAFASRGVAQVREAPRPQVRGLVKSNDGTSLTVATGFGRDNPADRTFAISPTAEFAVGSPFGGRGSGMLQEAKAAEIAAGTVVTLTLSPDEKTVEAVVADEPQVRGVVKSVDVTAKTLTIELNASRREEAAEAATYVISSDVEIAVDDGRGRRFSVKEGSLADLAQGAMVSATLSLDRKTLRSVLAEGPTLVGTVKSFDPASRTLTLTARSPRDGMPEDRVLSLATDGVIQVDDGKGRRLSIKPGKPADVVAGATATVRLSPDQGRAMMVRIAGPVVVGQFKAADAANGTITLSLFKGRGEPPEERTISVAKDALILNDGATATLADLKPAENGPFVQVRMGLDQTTAQSIQAQSGRR